MSGKHNQILKLVPISESRIRTVLMFLLLTMSYGLSTIDCLYPAFQDTGWGPRAGGMGNSFTAIANDPSATLWNPAGIAQIEMLETTFMYDKLFAGLEGLNLSQMYAAGVYPTDIGAFGLTITDFSLWDFYRENTVSASYAHDFGAGLGVEFPMMAGLNLKYLTHSYILDDRTKNMNDPVFAGGTSAGGFTPDAGVLLKPGAFSFGLSALNILQPDVGLKTEDKIPMILKFGTAYRAGDLAFFENITPTIDVSYRKPADNAADLKISGGVETWFNYNTWAARFGGNDREITLGFSYNKMFSTSGLQLDYAFSMPLQLTDASGGSHRLSLTFRYSLDRKKSEKVKAKEAAAGKEDIVIPPAPASPVKKQNSVKPVQKAPAVDVISALKKKYYDEAFAHFQKGEYELAIAGWEEVLKIDPNHVESKNKIAAAKKKLAEKNKPSPAVKPAPAEGKLDINSADAIALQGAGFTTVRAKNIINYRKKKKFNKIEDLLAVPGITSGELDKIKGKLTVK